MAMFHGEQLVVFFLIALLVIFALLCVISYLLVRVFRKRFGARAYLLAPVPFMLAIATGVVLVRADTPNTGPPTVLSGDKARGIIKALPEYASFGYSGLAFFDGQLYVSTNIGLLEVHGDQLVRLYRAQKKYSVVSGPWIDTSDHLLWLMDDDARNFLVFDGSSWYRVSEPTPAAVHAGTMLEGVRPISTPDGFWLAAGGEVWKWSAANRSWTTEKVPIRSSLEQEEAEVVGALPLDGKLVLIMRHEILPFLTSRNATSKSDSLVFFDGDWHDVPLGDITFLADNWAVSRSTGYICTKGGVLLRVTSQDVAKMDAPGDCEALSVSSEHYVAASFRGKGIYRFDGKVWQRKTFAPETSDGEYWAHLADNGYEVAYAMTGKPVIANKGASGTDIKWTRTPPTKLWVLKGDTFEQINVE